MMMKNGLEIIWKKAAMAYCKVQFQHLKKGLREIKKIPQSK
jgi:hypothetical protein